MNFFPYVSQSSVLKTFTHYQQEQNPALLPLHTNMKLGISFHTRSIERPARNLRKLMSPLCELVSNHLGKFQDIRYNRSAFESFP